MCTFADKITDLIKEAKRNGEENIYIDLNFASDLVGMLEDQETDLTDLNDEKEDLYSDIAELEADNSTMIKLGMDYQARKAKLTELYAKKAVKAISQ